MLKMKFVKENGTKSGINFVKMSSVKKRHLSESFVTTSNWKKYGVNSDRTWCITWSQTSLFGQTVEEVLS